MQSRDPEEHVNVSGVVPGREARLSSLQKESKLFRQKFRSLLDAKDVRPATPNLEFARKELRNVYLKLLFHFTFSGRTRGIEGSIWIETTHPLVHLYRNQLVSIESKIRALKQARGGIGTDGTTRDNRAQHGIKKAHQQKLSQWGQSYIKQTAAFRAFLESEEAFWCDLAARIARIFDLQEAYPHLRALDILTERFEVPLANHTTGLERITHFDGISPELQEQAQLPTNRQRLIEIIHKSLICCGDLARYRELYREEPKEEQPSRHAAGHRGGSRGRGRGRGGHEAHAIGSHEILKQAKPRDFARAARCYEYARHLIPSHGNPWNQLAVLAAYRTAPFSSVYHYYRALCVSEPFEKAKTNLEKTLAKALEKWIEQGDQTRFFAESQPEHDHEIRRPTDLLDDLVVLHAIFFTRKQSLLFSSFPQHCVHNMSSLLQRKALHTDAIVQVTLTAIAALWIRRLWRGTSPTDAANGTASSIIVEHAILLHVCELAQTMFDLAASETAEAIAHAKEHPPTGPRGDDGHSWPAARHITAVVRRMLPAMRIMSKWLKIHLGYVQRCRQTSSQPSTSLSADESLASFPSSNAYAKVSLGIDRLWASYAHFVNVIRFAFPFDSLPNLGTNVGQSGMTGLDFEEDRDIRGFTPMKKSTLTEPPSHIANGQQGMLNVSSTSALHPNEEHLIRVADLLIDAKVVAETELSPIHFDDIKNSFSFARPDDSQCYPDYVEAETGGLSADQSITRPYLDDEWQNASESSEDAVDLAMRAVDERRRALVDDGEDGVEEDEEDEIILVPSRNLSAESRQSINPLPEREMDTVAHSHDEVLSRQATSAGQSPSPNSGLTAQHLFLQVLNGSPRSSLPPTNANVAVDTAGAVSPFHRSTAQGASFGAIGSPLAHGTSSPPSAGRALGPAWGPSAASRAGIAHRSDIWAPPGPAGDHSPHVGGQPFPLSPALQQPQQQLQKPIGAIPSSVWQASDSPFTSIGSADWGMSKEASRLGRQRGEGGYGTPNADW